MVIMEKNKENEEWKAEKRMYEGIYASRTGNATKIIDIQNEDELGYTSSDGNIHLKEDHEIMEGMSSPEKAAFRTGVFCHEMLHQIFTDFDYLEELIDGIKEEKRKEVVSLFTNLIEDPAIEHRAPEVVGGSILKSLNYSILTIYERSPEIQTSDGPFSELCNALIQFGDMGIIKGHFSEGVLPYFRKIAPEFNAQILNPVSKERMQAAEQWAEITRPLWETMSKEELQKSCQEIMDNASSQMQSGGTPPTEKYDSEDYSEGSDPPSKAEQNRNKGLDELRKGNLSSLCKDSEEAKKEAEKAMVITAADLSDIETKIFDNMDSFAQEVMKAVAPMTVPVVLMPEYNGHKNKDITMNGMGNREEYVKILEPLKKDIRVLTRSLNNMLLNDYDENIRSTSGRYNIRQGIKGTTVKVFDKRKEKKNISDLAVTILVDQSGSMSGNRITEARNCTIILTEAFSNLKIPCSVIGFTADTDEADAVHRHFVSFRNLATERTSLSMMEAYANNYDGYSIRYAGRIMQKYRAEHKILFVISDGQPACRNYYARNGIEDTTKAIREMGRFMSVMGIGIGAEDNVFMKMYNGSFVSTRPENLTIELVKQLKRIIRKY